MSMAPHLSVPISVNSYRMHPDLGFKVLDGGSRS